MPVSPGVVEMKLLCAAVLFDLDGVLVDSGPLADRHWQRWAEAHDVPFRNILAVHHGRPSVETIRLVAPHLDAEIEGPKREAAEAADTEGLKAFAGAQELLQAIPDERWAIVTSSKRPTALRRLKHVGLPIPKVLVTSDDVARGKPSPEPYSLAAKLLGFCASRCIVIEDAPSGFESARAAGSKVVAISSNQQRLADFTVARLADIAFTGLGGDGIEMSIPGLSLTATRQ